MSHSYWNRLLNFSSRIYIVLMPKLHQIHRMVLYEYLFWLILPLNIIEFPIFLIYHHLINNNNNKMQYRFRVNTYITCRLQLTTICYKIKKYTYKNLSRFIFTIFYYYIYEYVPCPLYTFTKSQLNC